jgi:hypothetical protein
VRAIILKKKSGQTFLGSRLLQKRMFWGRITSFLACLLSFEHIYFTFRGLKLKTRDNDAFVAQSQSAAWLPHALISAGLLWGLKIKHETPDDHNLMLAPRGCATGVSIVRFFLFCVIVAGATSSNAGSKAMYLQVVPALIALSLSFIS